MTQPTLASLGGDSGSPLRIGRAADDNVDQSGASPDVLRELHAGWVRQLRGHVIGWSVVAVASIMLWRFASARASGSLLLFVGLITFQWIRAAIEWHKARRIDPVAIGSSAGVETTAVEREKGQALHRLMLERGARATWTIAGIVIALGVIEWLTTGSVARTVARAGLIKPLVSEGEWWRLATAAFVHANLWHLAANVVSFLAIGRVVEACVPRPWLFLTYAVSGVAGNLASWWVTPHASSLGASGAVLGVMGFLLVLGYRRPDDIPKALRERVLMVLVATGYVGALSFGLIDNGAHAGGAAAGVAIALIAVPRRSSSLMPVSSAWLPVLGFISAVAIVAGAVMTTVALADGSTAFTLRRSLGRDTFTPVRSVSGAVGHDDAGWFLAVTNRSSQVLEAYELTIEGPMVTAHMRRDDCCFASSQPGPVPPGGVVRVPIDRNRAPEHLGRRVTFSLAVFSDGSFEGSSRARDILRVRRTQAQREATFWIGAIDRIAAGPPASTASRLSLYRDVRSGYDDASNAALVGLGIPALITSAEQNPAGFVDAAAATRAAILTSREALAERLAQMRQRR